MASNAPSTRRRAQRPVSRPVLRPGLQVFRRDDTHLQVGIDEPRVVLRDTPGVRQLLRELDAGAGLGTLTPEAGLAFGRLLDADLVVDRADLVAGARGERRGAVTATFAAHGPAAPARLARRAACRVGVIAPEPWFTVASDSLDVACLAPALDTGAPTVTLLVSCGEPLRSRVDRLVRDDHPHLLLTLLPDGARLGPFVAPGLTACLRCLDAHVSEADPRRGLVLAQLEDGASRPVPCDPVLAPAAMALAVRELATYAEGDRPATWSATVELGAAMEFPRREWARHPHCGCSWG